MEEGSRIRGKRGADRLRGFKFFCSCVDTQIASIANTIQSLSPSSSHRYVNVQGDGSLALLTWLPTA